jgi:hypothetical protein
MVDRMLPLVGFNAGVCWDEGLCIASRAVLHLINLLQCPFNLLIAPHSASWPGGGSAAVAAHL